MEVVSRSLGTRAVEGAEPEVETSADEGCCFPILEFIDVSRNVPKSDSTWPSSSSAAGNLGASLEDLLESFGADKLCSTIATALLDQPLQSIN
jgi:hypothetical protein